MLIADLMHHPLQIRYPEWSTRFCVDPARGAADSAPRFLNEHADTGRLIFTDSFSDPQRRPDRADGEAYRFVFDGEG